MKKLMVLIVFMFCMMLTSIGWAADAVAPSPTADLIVAFLDQVLFPFVGGLLAILISVVLVKLRQKYNLDISAQTESVIIQTAYRAVQATEEFAAAKVKDGVKISSLDKHEKALGMIREALPTLTPSEAEVYLRAALANIKGMGATKEIGTTV